MRVVSNVTTKTTALSPDLSLFSCRLKMLRFLMLVLALAALTAATKITDTHKVFRITPENEDQVKLLSQFEDVEGFTYWKEPSPVSKTADLMVAPEKLKDFIHLMSSNNIKFETFIESVEKLLESETRNKSLTRAGGFGWTSYHKLEEIYNWLDSLAEIYPEKVKVIVGGRTYEGRQIKGVKLSFGQEKPGVFIEGGIHAREWISPATVTYLLNELLTSRDQNIRNLAESYDWYIFPVFNPDGYAYTHINPRQMTYRFWRKSRSPNPFQASCYGTDLNRNWNYQWRVVGASRDPCSEAYAGSQAFSEIETRTLAKYIGSISHKLFAYISFHSYSQFLMFPYGHTKNHLDNYNQQYAVAQKAVKALSKRYGTTYKYGSIADVIGYASGGSVDYIKAQFKLPFVFVYELRDTGKTGFVLPANQIVPNAQEVMDSFIALFAEAKKFQ